jgi:hypothetical protein
MKTKIILEITGKIIMIIIIMKIIEIAIARAIKKLKKRKRII